MIIKKIWDSTPKFTDVKSKGDNTFHGGTGGMGEIQVTWHKGEKCCLMQ